MKSHGLKAVCAASAVAVAIGLTAGTGSSASAIGCVPASNVEALVDDSGSTSGTDPSNFRADLLTIIAQINDGKTFGGIEFGSSASVLFGPGLLPGIYNDVVTSLTKLTADNGGTDFNLAFNTGNQHNPTANTRIFLTDGQATKPTAHLTPSVPTHVVALNGGGSINDATLAKLGEVAAETGGSGPYIATNGFELLPIAARVTSAMNCVAPPLEFVRSFSQAGQQYPLKFRAQHRRATVVVTWPTSNTVIVPAKKKGAQLKLKVQPGVTFSTAALKGLQKGKPVKFLVRAQAVGAPTTATIQVIR